MRVIPFASADLSTLSVTSDSEGVFAIDAPVLRCAIMPTISVANDPVSMTSYQVIADYHVFIKYFLQGYQNILIDSRKSENMFTLLCRVGVIFMSCWCHLRLSVIL